MYVLDNVGKSTTKYTFAEVFKEAWLNTVKLSTIVRCAGIWPVNAMFAKVKLLLLLYIVQIVAQMRRQTKTLLVKLKVMVIQKLAVKVMESTLLVLYEEGYDIMSGSAKDANT